MYARVNTIFGTEGKIGDGVDHIEGFDRGLVESTVGNQGLTTLVDRAAGVIVAMSYWDDLQHSSEATLTRAREGAAIAAGGELVTETFEVVLTERPAVPAPGAVIWMTRVRLAPSEIDTGLAFIHDDLLHRLSADPGLSAAELLIDRDIGSGLLVTTWTDQAAADRGQAVLDEVGEGAAARVGTTFPRSESYVLVRQST
jgi:hypothetical protein